MVPTCLSATANYTLLNKRTAPSKSVKKMHFGFASSVWGNGILKVDPINKLSQEWSPLANVVELKDGEAINPCQTFHLKASPPQARAKRVPSLPSIVYTPRSPRILCTSHHLLTLFITYSQAFLILIERLSSTLAFIHCDFNYVI